MMKSCIQESITVTIRLPLQTDGGMAFVNDEDGWGYGDKVSSEKEFLERFEALTMAIKKIPYVCGYCYTQVTDVQQEVNGLMDIHRNFKADARAIKEINERVRF